MRTTRSLAYGFPLALLTLATLACNSPEARAQDDGDDVPAAVDAELRAKYPDATDVDWGVDRNDNYEAHIEVQGVKMRVDISPAGEWIETERSVDYEGSPRGSTGPRRRRTRDVRRRLLWTMDDGGWTHKRGRIRP